MSTAGFFLGGMLGRIAGPIAQDWFKYKTKLGRDIALREEDAKKKMSQFELDNKLKISDEEHKKRLVQLEKQFVDSRKRAEEQMYIAREEWQQKLFWEKCFPLRNPYELPLGYEPVFEENSDRIKRCRLGTVSIANSRQIVPLRVITAIKDNSHETAGTVNGDLSMFLVNYFAVNSVHAVISDIGSWKEEAPINDASINYLFKGAKGQPTMVIVPVYTNGGSTVRLKVWSWGLGEELSYPIGFDFGWFNLDVIKRKVLYEELKKFNNILNEAGIILPDKELERDIKLLSKLEKVESSFAEEDFDTLLTTLKVPGDIKSIVERRTNEISSTIFSCLAGMHADSYHLSQYGTMPLLPTLLHDMKGVQLMFPFIRDYYMALANAKLIEGIIAPEQALSIEFTLGEQAKLISCSKNEIEPIVEDIGFLLKKSEQNEDVKQNYRSLLQRKSKLLTNIESNNKMIEK